MCSGFDACVGKCARACACASACVCACVVGGGGLIEVKRPRWSTAIRNQKSYVLLPKTPKPHITLGQIKFIKNVCKPTQISFINDLKSILS